jgi:hypothetical protein
VNSKEPHPIQLKEEMKLALDVDDIYRQLTILSNAEIIERGTSDYQFKALNSNNVIIPAFLSLGGFTDEAIGKCNRFGIAMAENMELF